MLTLVIGFVFFAKQKHYWLIEHADYEMITWTNFSDKLQPQEFIAFPWEDCFPFQYY